jgi:hypothetical protein
MKFTLIIFLCSFINNQCLAPIQIDDNYNSWKECSIAALELSKELIVLQEDKFINNNKISTKFICQETEVI